MGKINILDEKVSNMIAAGEVVERPASLIKELLENSIDAKSTKIVISIKNANRYVKISDNGSGMSKEDLLISIERHATSKINTKDDLFNIMTYGFRGEALSSISAVSKLTITSKDEVSEVGTKMTSHAGKIVNIFNIPRDRGTEIEVKDLFYNTPARLKFLKKDTTEFRAIKDTVLLEALANPNISITLLNNEKEVLRTSGRGMKNTILELFGKEALENLISFPLGFLGNLSLNRSNKDFIFVFVNNRPVKSSLIENALIDGYYTKLMKGRYPFAILFLEIDPREVDVNVHPTKKIIKFSDEEKIYSYVYNEIQDKLFGDDDFVAPIIKTPSKENFLSVNDFKRETLQGENISFDLKKEKIKELENLNENKFFYNEKIEETKKENIDNLLEINDFSLKNEKNIKNIFKNNEKTDKLENEEEVKETMDISYEVTHREKDYPLVNKEPVKNKYKLVGQLNDTYILIERQGNLEIYDQHIIHERILYEKFKKDYYEKKISTQNLLVPIKFKVSNKEKEILDENLEILREFGYEIDNFQGNDILVRSVPNLKFNCTIEELIKNLIDNLKNTRLKNVLLEEGIISLSCKKAIKANQKLSNTEIEILFEKLFEVEEYTCPHGRPILLKLSLHEIEKHFGRLGSK